MNRFINGFTLGCVLLPLMFPPMCPQLADCLFLAAFLTLARLVFWSAWRFGTSPEPPPPLYAKYLTTTEKMAFETLTTTITHRYQEAMNEAVATIARVFGVKWTCSICGALLHHDGSCDTCSDRDLYKRYLSSTERS